MMCHRGTAFAKYCGIRFLFFITSATSNEGKKDNIEFLNVKRVMFYKNYIGLSALLHGGQK